jgi:hypothetical protein
MKLSKGEYCRLSLGGRWQLVTELGELIGGRRFDQLFIQVFKMYDFYIEVHYELPQWKVVYVAPLKNMSMLALLGSDKG